MYLSYDDLNAFNYQIKLNAKTDMTIIQLPSLSPCDIKLKYYLYRSTICIFFKHILKHGSKNFIKSHQTQLVDIINDIFNKNLATREKMLV